MALFTDPRLLGSARWKNMRIGLLGGSFNPPHKGHIHISLAAMNGLRLDAVWWLVTPQNPLKDKSPLPLEKRVALSRDIITHPKILVTDIEKEIGATITYYSVRALVKYFPYTDFVWISGMDNARSLHQWHHWRALLEKICMVHLTRMPARSLVQNCPLRMYGRQNHVFVDHAGRLPLKPGTTYWMLQKKMVNISSTEIREKDLAGQ